MLPLTRRRLLAGSSAAAVAALAQRRARGQAPFDAARHADLITPPTQKAIDRGLSWLAKRQLMSGAGEGSSNIWFTFTHHVSATFAEFWAHRAADGFNVAETGAMACLYQNAID